MVWQGSTLLFIFSLDLLIFSVLIYEHILTYLCECGSTIPLHGLIGRSNLVGVGITRIREESATKCSWWVSKDAIGSKRSWIDLEIVRLRSLLQSLLIIHNGTRCIDRRALLPHISRCECCLWDWLSSYSFLVPSLSLCGVLIDCSSGICTVCSLGCYIIEVGMSCQSSVGIGFVDITVRE